MVKIIPWAKSKGIRPQTVYGWIRNKTIPAQFLGEDEKGKAVIKDEEGMDRWFQAKYGVKEVGEGEQLEAQTSSPVNTNDYISTATRSGNVRVQKVKKVGDKIAHIDDGKGGIPTPFNLESLRDRIGEGSVGIESPRTVMSMLAQHLESQGFKDLADEMLDIKKRFKEKEAE